MWWRTQKKKNHTYSVYMMERRPCGPSVLCHLTSHMDLPGSLCPPPNSGWSFLQHNRTNTPYCVKISNGIVSSSSPKSLIALPCHKNLSFKITYIIFQFPSFLNNKRWDAGNWVSLNNEWPNIFKKLTKSMMIEIFISAGSRVKGLDPNRRQTDSTRQVL